MRNNVILFFIGSLILFIALSVVFQSTAKEVVKKQQELNAFKQEEKNTPAFEKVIENKKEQIALLEESFPGKKDLPQVPLELEQIGANTGVLAVLHFGSEEITQDKNGQFIIPVNITAEGKYGNIINFLGTLKKGRYLYAFTSFESDAPQGIKNDNKLIMRGNLFVSNK